MLKKVFPVIAVCVFAAQTGIAIISPLLSVYAHDIGDSALWVGLIFGGYSVSRAFVMPLIGRLSDRRGRRVFVAGGMALSAAVSLLYIFADNLTLLFAVRILHGAISGAIVPPARAWIAELSPPGQEARWQGYFNTAFFTGAGAGPLLGGLLHDTFAAFPPLFGHFDPGMAAAFGTMGALNLVGFLLVSLVLRETSERKSRDRPPVSFRNIGRSRLFQGLFVQRFSKEFSVACFIAFMPLYVSTKLDISLTLIGALLAGNLFFSSWLQILTGRLADRFDRRRMVIAGSLVSYAVMATIPFAANLRQLVVLFFIRALGTAISMPGSAGLYVGIGLALGPILSGLVAEFTEIRSVFFFAAGMGFIGLVLFAVLSTREPREPTPEQIIREEETK